MLKKYNEVPIGGTIEGVPTSINFKTGDWKSLTPVVNHDKCKKCKMCTIFCPDEALIFNEKTKQIEIDLEYCKGCGICDRECKFNAIEMKDMRGQK